MTIQNHGGYEDEDYETTVQVNEVPGEYPQAEQYLSLTKKSDEALEYLIDYFSQQEEPVVILFFGDHWPNRGSLAQPGAGLSLSAAGGGFQRTLL